MRGQVQYAVVCPDLTPGDYHLWRDATTPASTFTVADGEVTSHHWPA